MAASVERPCAAILVAAGAGERLGAAVPKAFVTVGGASLLEHALNAFRDHPAIHEIIVVVPADLVAEIDEPGTTVVAGGSTRQESVAAGLAASSDEGQHV